LDVREEDEWEDAHVLDSLHIPYHDLRDGVPADLRNGGGQLAVACSAGNRSSIAASLLKRAGVDDIVHVAEGGIADLAAEGVELVRGP
ncbi:MAG: rhodanese-like domain-containing protein, partial [Gaiellaceae bacterium]